MTNFLREKLEMPAIPEANESDHCKPLDFPMNFSSPKSNFNSFSKLFNDELNLPRVHSESKLWPLSDTDNDKKGERLG